jgi:DNA-binding PadR family transcriptional regulator
MSKGGMKMLCPCRIQKWEEKESLCPLFLNHFSDTLKYLIEMLPRRGNMKPRDWLLIFLLSRPNEPGKIDPLRIIKGLFLLTKEAPLSQSEAYVFVPHYWGPFSKEVYNDLDDLEAEGYVKRTTAMGKSWRFAELTEKGIATAKGLVKDVPKLALSKLEASKREATTRSFDDLLRYVYNRYPEFATNSIWSKN